MKGVCLKREIRGDRSYRSTVGFTIRLEEKMFERLVREAKEKETSLSAVLRQMIETGMEQHGLIYEI